MNKNRLIMLAMLVLAWASLQNCAFSQEGDPPDMPYPRVGMCSVTIGDTLYLIGGAQGLQGRDFLSMRGTSTVQAFNLRTKTWITGIAPLQTPRVFACAAALDDSIYVMGGVDSLGRVLSSVEVYDPTRNEWHYAPSMGFARKGAAATAFGDSILVFGGGDSMNVLRREVDAYSPEDGTWEVLPHGTVLPRAFQTVATIGNSVYILGGLGSTVGPVSLIERYVPSIGVVGVQVRWSRARAFFGLVIRGDSVFVISGWGQSGMQNGYFNDVQMFDFQNPNAAVMRSANVSVEEPRRGFVAAAGRDGQIYLFGGVSPEHENGQFPIAEVTTLYNVTAVRQTPNTVPTKFGLSQNYPNPFNPTTTIQFDVPAPGAKVRLDIYNMLGERVVTLVDGYVAGGSHSVSFNGANIASGSYIYRLSTPNGNMDKRMVLIK